MLAAPEAYETLFEAESGYASAGLLLMILWIPVEGWLLSRYSTTPGKWMYATRVERVSEAVPVGVGTGVTRAFSVYMRGMGFGIPIVYLITMLVAYSKLTDTGRTTWDRKNETRVVHRTISDGRTTLLIAFWLVWTVATISAYT